jgi:S1-C subfamily serine protease
MNGKETFRRNSQAVPANRSFECRRVPVHFAGLIPGVLLAAALLALPDPVRADDAKIGSDKSSAANGTVLSAETKSSTVEKSVVKVFSTVRYPDPYKPWTKQAPKEVSGSGVVIAGKRILSNAHLVQYASQVQVQANEAGDKISATVDAVAPGIDLAILKLEDETFFDSHPPLARSDVLPEIKDTVMAYGYPEGGTSLSITKGIVSRIDFAAYSYAVSGLRIQIDAAINPGNSGGPAVANEKMVGLAFSHLGASDNIGYIIPCEEIELFLQDVADGHYDGKPALFDDLQTLENAALRSFLQLDKSVQGVVVHSPDSTAPDYPLKEWDVITKIGDTPVDNQGMISLSANLRVSFRYLVQKITTNGQVPLTVMRAGKVMPVKIQAATRRPLVLTSLEGAYPPYFVYGPLVFSNATAEFGAGLTRSAAGTSLLARLGAMGSPLVRRLGDRPDFDGERLVVVSSPFFPHRLTKGYSSPFSLVVKTINGIRIKNLGHLVEVLRDTKDEFIRIDFDTRGAETLVFPRAEMLAAVDEILTDNGVRSQGSPETLAIWNAKAAR